MYDVMLGCCGPVGDQGADVAQAWARGLSLMTPLALRYSKEALRRAQQTDLSDTIVIEGRIQDVIMESHDAKEGIVAFIEKRKPAFFGH